MKCDIRLSQSETDNLRKMKPKPLINFPSTLTLNINNKQDLRGIITDFILHSIQGEKQPSKVSESGKYTKKYKQKHPFNVTYPSILLSISVNKQIKKLTIDLLLLLKIFKRVSKKMQFHNFSNESRLEPMIVDILNFIDGIQQQIKGVDFQIGQKYTKKQINKKAATLQPQNEEQNCIKDPKLVELLVSMIIERHIKDKNRVKFAYEDDHPIDTNITAKHMRVSYIDISDHLKRKQKQFTLQIKGRNSQFFQDKSDDFVIIPSKISNISDQLNKILTSNNFLQQSEQISRLKQQAIIKFYEADKTEYLQQKSKFQLQIEDAYLPVSRADYPYKSQHQNMSSFKSNTSFVQNTQQSLDMIKNWLVDISLSQKYYESKFGKANRYKKKEK